MTATLIICDTCDYATDQKLHEGKSGGEHFAAAVEAAAETVSAVEVRRFSCLMNCKRHCSAALSTPGKVQYVLGGFEPTAEDAQAIVDYAALYDESDTGVVPYRQWPQGVKGHFVSRVPSAAMLDEAE